MKRVLWVVLSSLTLVLAFPKFDLGWAAWFALVPLLAAIRDASPMAALGLSWLAGCIFFAGIFHWIMVIEGFNGLHFFVLMIYLGSFFALFGVLLSVVLRSTRLPLVLTAPILWVSVEYLRSHAGFLALPWGLLAHSQYLAPPVMQISGYTGAYGVSFIVVMANAAVLELLINRFRPSRETVPAFGAVGGVIAFGLFQMSPAVAGPTVKVAVIQGNIPQSVKWDAKAVRQNLQKHVALTRQAAESTSAPLIIWPEVAITTPLNYDPNTWKTVSSLARETGANLFIGSSERPIFGSREFISTHHYNSAFLLYPNGKLDRFYHKIRLLPFAEYLPLEGRLPWPSSLVSKMADNVPGGDFAIFDMDGIRFAGLICWENIFPELFRQFAMKGVDFMVNITNEAWFGDTAASYQFVSMSVLRAVENRVSIVRSANTGISCFIDPLGRIMQRLTVDGRDVLVEGFLAQEVPISRERTFYTFHGDVFAHSVLAASLLLLGFASWGRFRASKRAA